MTNRSITVTFDDADALSPIIAILAEHRLRLDNLQPGESFTFHDEKGAKAGVVKMAAPRGKLTALPVEAPGASVLGAELAERVQAARNAGRKSVQVDAALLAELLTEVGIEL